LLGTTFRSLEERDYAWFFAANFGFFMAIHMQFVLYGYLAFDLTDSATSLSLVSAAVTVPAVVAAPLAGPLADRVNKRVLLAANQFLAAAASAALAVLVFADLVQLWHIAVVALIVGTVLAVNMPARQAIVPQLVPRHKLMNAVSLQMGVMNLTMILAPAIAGALISPIGVGWVFLLSSALFVAGTAFETRLPVHGLTGTRSASLVSDARQGIRYLAGNPVLRLLFLANTLVIMFAFPVQQTLPVFAKDVFDRGPAGLGTLVAMSGVGGLLGSLFASQMDADQRKGRAMFFGGVVMGAFYAGFAIAPSFAVALPLLALGAAGQMFFYTVNNSVVLATAGREVRGRVMAIMPMAIGLTPMAVFPVAVATDNVGAPTAVAVSSLLMLALLFLLFGAAGALRNLRLEGAAHADLSPAEAARLVAEGSLSELEADHLSGQQSVRPVP